MIDVHYHINYWLCSTLRDLYEDAAGKLDEGCCDDDEVEYIC